MSSEYIYDIFFLLCSFTIAPSEKQGMPMCGPTSALLSIHYN